MDNRLYRLALLAGLLLMAAAIIMIVCSTGQVSLLMLMLAVAVQTAESHIAFGYLYHQVLNVCYRGRMMLYLSLLSLAGALGDKNSVGKKFFRSPLWR